MLRPGPGPSPAFGTRTIPKPVERPDHRRLAVLTICRFAKAKGATVTEIRELLTILGLDPREGLMCDVHGDQCYAIGCGSDKIRGGKPLA